MSKKKKKADITALLRADTFTKEDIKEFKEILKDMQQDLKKAGAAITVTVREVKRIRNDDSYNYDPVV